MIVDSSVWVGFLSGADDPEVLLLKHALETKNPVWILPVILREVLQGADSEHRFARWSKPLSAVPALVSGDAMRTNRDAALLYARCRWAGVTPRSANDCLIAQSAIEANLPLLHRDRDFTRIAAVDNRLRLIPI